MDQLPTELIDSILLKVESTSDLKALMLASKSMQRMVSSPAFKAAWLCAAYGPQRALGEALRLWHSQVIVIDELIQQHHADINGGDAHVFSGGDDIGILHMASLFASPDIVRFLVSVPGLAINKVSPSDSRQITALFYACAKRRLEVVRELLLHPSIDVNKHKPGGVTALFGAIMAGPSGASPAPDVAYGGDIVRELLKHPSINVNFADSFGQSALHMACHYGQTDCVEALLQHEGVQVNIRSMEGLSGLMMACNAGHMEVVRVLLQCPRLDLGEIPAAHAAALDQGHMEVAALIEHHQSAVVALHDAVASPADAAIPNVEEVKEAALIEHFQGASTISWPRTPARATNPRKAKRTTRSALD